MFLFRLVTLYMGILLFFTSFYSLIQGFIFYFSLKVIFVEWEVFSLFGGQVIMTMLFDWMSLIFLGFVSFISSMVLFYSTSYMSGDKFIYRFIMLVYLFVISMLLLIVSPNLISILLGWDGLGLVSYCLVIYYQNVKSANAGMLTVLSNRVGDVAILLSIAWLANYGSWNFYYLQIIYSNLDLGFILFLVVLAAMTKSAQIPFSAWLPAAMAAPTPVSALVHSSTLVTAGVYLLIRFHELLMINNFMFVVGVFTMFMSGLGANYEMDLKKIIALSTLSQLGVMMMTLSVGLFELAFFHLLSHALFKSLLFLCAGAYIHGMGDTQDIRLLGGLDGSLVVSSFYFMGCSFSLCGFPFLAGFYSKDAILENYMMMEMNIFMVFSVILGTLFTATYSLRLAYYLFFKNLGLKTLVHLSECDIMLIPMSFLFFISIIAGSLMSWCFFPAYMIYLPLMFKCLVLFLLTLFVILFYQVLSMGQLKLIIPVLPIIHFLGSMWFLPYFSTILFSSSLFVGKLLIKYLDQGWVEVFGAQGLFRSLGYSGAKFDSFYFINLKVYLMVFFIFILFML